MTKEEIEGFEAKSHYLSAVKVRKFDDNAKVKDLEIKPIYRYRRQLESMLHIPGSKRPTNNGV